MSSHHEETSRGQRFEFGENWQRFLGTIDEQRIRQAEQSLQTMLQTDTLQGKRFLDIGSGSGLFSLAARRLGAQVCSFDYDPRSVACTRELKRRYFANDPAWRIEEGSVLQPDYMAGLGQFDVVYSWGVLHHTGAMWQALDQAAQRVAPGRQIFIAIYNDQGGTSRRWHLLKRIYNRLPAFLRLPYTLLTMGPRELKFLAQFSLKGRPQDYFRHIAHYSRNSLRGMSYWHDVVDWIGGYPFEVAKPEQIFDFFRQRGFTLQRLTTCGGGQGCNEFVFTRTDGQLEKPSRAGGVQGAPQRIPKTYQADRRGVSEDVTPQSDRAAGYSGCPDVPQP